MSKRIERMINSIYTAVFNKVFNRKAITQASKGRKDIISSRIVQLELSKDYDKFARKFSKKLATAGLSSRKGIWRKYYQAAKAKRYIVLPSTYSDYEKQVMAKIVEKNFTMIKSIPSQTLKVYEQKNVQTVVEQIAEGKVGRKTFEEQLKKQGATNARVIARTESSKLQTAIDETIATNLGSKCYFWMSTKDKRTRKSHQEMNKVVVFWKEDSQKPLRDKMRGNTGEFPNCRCTDIPILDENDLKDNHYKVYDYRNDTIISMSKKELLNAISKGGLE